MIKDGIWTSPRHNTVMQRSDIFIGDTSPNDIPSNPRASRTDRRKQSPPHSPAPIASESDDEVHHEVHDIKYTVFNKVLNTYLTVFK